MTVVIVWFVQFTRRKGVNIVVFVYVKFLSHQVFTFYMIFKK